MHFDSNNDYFQIKYVFQLWIDSSALRLPAQLIFDRLLLATFVASSLLADKEAFFSLAYYFVHCSINNVYYIFCYYFFHLLLVIYWLNNFIILFRFHSLFLAANVAVWSVLLNIFLFVVLSVLLLFFHRICSAWL